ncbi:YgcG family protein [candidate division KSB1 bacterium]|nr:YgcG family protein [candidate division KSB1 bacterium]
MKKLFSIPLFMTFMMVASAPALEVPYLTGRVNDYANVLSEEAKQQLTIKLEQHEQATSNQIVVLTLSSLGDENLEDFAVTVFDTWKLGEKGKDNGVLLLISIQDRKMRIEVGYGLEGTLPDGLAGSIIRSEIVPQFRRGDYDAGINAGVDAIIAAIEGEYTAETPTEAGDDFDGLAFPFNLIFGLFIVSILGVFTISGVFTKGCMSWFMYVFLIPFYATFPMFILGSVSGTTLLGAYLIGYPLFKLIFGSRAGQNYLKNRFPKLYKLSQSGIKWSSGRSSGKSWSSSSGWSSGSSFSSGSSSFSGGGGSSGGGGASGSW